MFAVLALVIGPHLHALPSQTEWFVAGAGAAARGDDSNPGTA
jgi:hypothetical protein